MVTELNKYIDESIQILNEQIEKIVDKRDKLGIWSYLTHDAEMHYKTDTILQYLECIKDDIEYSQDITDKDEWVRYFEHIIEVRTKQRMESNPMPYNTNPMVNLTALWEFDCYNAMIKYATNMLNIVKKY